jgi:outer membrane protein insertion porin family
MHSFSLDLRPFKRTVLLAAACVLGPAMIVTSWAQGVGSGTRAGAPFPEARTQDRNAPYRTPTLNLSGAATGGRNIDAAPAEMVVGVRVEGNKKVLLRKIEPFVKTRPGKPYNLDTIKADVRRLIATRLFVDVQPFSQKTNEGVIVVFRVVERPVLEYVKYIGNHKVQRKHLVRESGLLPGSPLDPYAVSEAKRKIKQYYAKEGYSEARVEIIEGTDRNDRGAVFLINETKPKRVWSVDFIGNTIASDGRLATQIKSKPPFSRAMFLVTFTKSGVFNRQVLDDDVKRLTLYYKNLGFFNARVGREIHADEGSGFVEVTFVIDEGPRFKVRNVSVIGNEKISREEIMDKLKIKAGEHFNQASMNADIKQIAAVYGSHGYIYSDIQPVTRYLGRQHPGELDLVYKINEGQRYRVGSINVHVGGENPHTRVTTILNRLHLRPGDVADQSLVEASMVGLKRSALFARDQPGVSRGPRSAFRPPEEAIQRRVVDRRSSAGSSRRYQSPDRVEQRPAPPGNPYWNIRTDGYSRSASRYDESSGAYRQREFQSGRIR